MPNWCYTSYIVIGDENELNDLYEKMESLDKMENSLVENGFGKTWLGNLVTLLGGDWEKIRCRGMWIWIEKEEGILRFDTETAWVDMKETIDFIQEKYPNITFYYMAEEPGNEYFVTNDASGEIFSERYYLDFHDGEALYYDELGLENVLEDLSEKLGKAITTLEEAKKAICEHNKKVDWEQAIELRVYKVI